MSESAQFTVQDAHSHTLNLARAGSTQFALSEYLRHGLDKIRSNEDIMALHGRLYKDLFLSQSGKEAKHSAQLSAEKYEIAFKDTQGFYSGINAASMSLMAGYAEDMVRMRAQRILDILPATEVLDSESKYFVEATRAEAQLLLGDIDAANESMREALNHDPLNYTAHASTLKQFRMIAAYRKTSYDWLENFQPPVAVHFAGHMFGIEEEKDTKLPCLTETQIDELVVQISEMIQTQDIGFGYGALAAGSDILIAEAIIEEGGELHVTLPVNKAAFIAASVKPFGASWVDRFESCLLRASSMRIISETASKPVSSLLRQASLANMGAAIRQAESLSVPSIQLLIWDKKSSVVGTAIDAKLWDATARHRHIIKYNGSRSEAVQSGTTAAPKPIFTLSSDGQDDLSFDNLDSAITKALIQRQDLNPAVQQVLNYKSDEAIHLSLSNIEHALPGSIVLSESVADYLVVHHFEEYGADLIDVSEISKNIYALREKGSSAI